MGSGSMALQNLASKVSGFTVSRLRVWDWDVACRVQAVGRKSLSDGLRAT